MLKWFIHIAVFMLFAVSCGGMGKNESGGEGGNANLTREEATTVYSIVSSIISQVFNDTKSGVESAELNGEPGAEYGDFEYDTDTGELKGIEESPDDGMAEYYGKYNSDHKISYSYDIEVVLVDWKNADAGVLLNGIIDVSLNVDGENFDWVFKGSIKAEGEINATVEIDINYDSDGHSESTAGGYDISEEA